MHVSPSQPPMLPNMSHASMPFSVSDQEGLYDVEPAGLQPRPEVSQPSIRRVRQQRVASDSGKLAGTVGPFLSAITQEVLAQFSSTARLSGEVKCGHDAGI